MERDREIITLCFWCPANSLHGTWNRRTSATGRGQLPMTTGYLRRGRIDQLPLRRLRLRCFLVWRLGSSWAPRASDTGMMREPAR